MLPAGLSWSRKRVDRKLTNTVSFGNKPLKNKDGGVMRIFEVRNRAYKACTVVAPDQEAAIAACRDIKHMRRHGIPRKVADVTDEFLEEFPYVSEVLEAGERCVLQNNEGRWEPKRK